MPKLSPVSWRELIRRLRILGFQGPYWGGKHPYKDVCEEKKVKQKLGGFVISSFMTSKQDKILSRGIKWGGYFPQEYRLRGKILSAERKS